MIPPLCIIQARYHSTRLPGKMLLTLPAQLDPLDDVVTEETLIARAVRLATDAFGCHVCAAIPESDMDGPLGAELERTGVTIFTWRGYEWDVLRRFVNCALQYRWHPDAVIHRWTPDDPFKVPGLCREVAAGLRHPVVMGGEAWTLGDILDRDNKLVDPGKRKRNAYSLYRHAREHFGYTGTNVEPGWTVDTQEDYEAARARAEEEMWAPTSRRPMPTVRLEECTNRDHLRMRGEE